MAINEDMEHMHVRWRVGKPGNGDYAWIQADGKSGWAVARIYIFLPGDTRGHRTAQAICDEHNAALEGEK